MLRSLHIRDFVIVDRMDIGFDAGFTVFSGETGAGKSILVDARSAPTRTTPLSARYSICPMVCGCGCKNTR